MRGAAHIGLALALSACADGGQAPVAPPAPVVAPAVPPVTVPPPADLPRPDRPPDLVLITVESVRADHLALYGYPRETAPWLSALGAQGTVFEQAFSPSSWELPALVSLFTGLYPNQHGVDRGAPTERGVTGQPRLPDAHLTLAERLKDAGYATWGISSTAHAAADSGLAQGFDNYTDLGFASYEAVLAAARAWGTLPTAAPRFVWLHLHDPRGAYEAQAPWAQDWLADPTPLTALQVRAPDRDRDARVAEAGALLARYDSEIRAADGAIPEVLAALGLGDDAVIAVAATSGETFFDHGGIGRRSALYDELTHVPLVIRWPGHLPVRVDAPVCTLDLLPTLVQIATGAAPADTSGTSLLPALTGGALPARSLPMELRMDDGRFLRGLVVDRYKLVRLDTGKINGIPALYDRVADPGELHDLAAEDPAETAALSAALETWLSTSPAVSPGPLLEVSTAPSRPSRP